MAFAHSRDAWPHYCQGTQGYASASWKGTGKNGESWQRLESSDRGERREAEETRLLRAAERLNRGDLLWMPSGTISTGASLFLYLLCAYL